ncbi:MAG: hypothetical protein ACP5SI_07130 [Chloroflexia bacterium]
MDDQPLSEETWRAIRREARRYAAEARRRQAEQLTEEAREALSQVPLRALEARLEVLGTAWAVHEKPLQSRVPLLGKFLGRIGRALLRFLLQHQVAFNAESVRAHQELYRMQRWLLEASLARSDDLFSRLDERLTALEARVRELEGREAAD